MAHERLGLFGSPPNRRELQIATALVGLLFVSFPLILAAHDVQLTQIDAFIPMIDGIMLPCELIIAAKLYAQAAVFRSPALIILASAFVFAALLLVPHVLTFPGAFAAEGLLGAGVNSTAWIYTFRRAAFPVAVILYVQFKHAKIAPMPGGERRSAQIVLGVLVAIALAVAVTLLATIGRDLLPPFFSNRTDRLQSYAILYHSTVAGLCLAALVMLFRKRASVLDLWLLVAVSAWLVQALLNVHIGARFTLGWYSLFGIILLSDLILMLALIAETSWLYSRLALSTAARARERNDRLMAMDAVTAAISHEVGQPLTAISLNASAALRWLSRARPNVEKAIMSLREVNDAGQRTFDVIRSVRSTFAKRPGERTEFGLNELVLETASLLDRELAATRVSLRLSLDDTLPPIRADRVQMQRLIVNLLTNAMESLTSTPGGNRQIAIRSEQLDGTQVILEVSDTGIGIAPEDLEHIFDVFFTTKATGTGLGLPLCRTIAEDHGGRLWATHGDPRGAMFHLRLPLGNSALPRVEEPDQILENLESSLRWLKVTKPDDAQELIAELQHVVDHLRVVTQRPER